MNRLRDAQWALGDGVRALAWRKKASNRVAAAGFGAPGVVVSYTAVIRAMQNGSKFVAEGMQIAAGVPLGL